MVERLQKEMKPSLTGVTFVDLDGTLLTVNSMHIFMRNLPRMLMKRGALRASLASLWRIGMRGLHMTDHRTMKWHLTKNARRHLQDSDWEELAARMARHVNTKVKDLIDSRRKRGCITYLATAAMEEYANPLCRLLGYEGVLATKFTDSLEEYEELSRYAKHDSIENLLHEETLRLESFITDHTDDIPTASAYPGLTIVVNPTEKTADEFRSIGVTRYIS